MAVDEEQHADCLRDRHEDYADVGPLEGAEFYHKDGDLDEDDEE